MASSNTRCPRCGETFKDLRGLNGHMRWKHSMSTEEIQQELDERKERGNPGVGDDRDTFTLIDRLSRLDRKREIVEKWSRSNFLRTDVGAEECLEALERIEDRIRKKLAAEGGSEVESVPDRDMLENETRQVFDLVDRFAECREKREKVENRQKPTEEAEAALDKIERNIRAQLPGVETSASNES